jgi:hypothetical protein
MQMYTDRQIALQYADEYSKRNPNMNSYDILRIAERYRKFLEDGTVETAPSEKKHSSTQGNAHHHF